MSRRQGAITLDISDGQSRSHRWRNALLASVALGAIVLGLGLATGFDPVDADVKYDWLSATAALSSDAYVDILDLAVEFDLPVGVHLPPGLDRPGAHPRSPGAILLALPLLFFDYDHLFAVATLITVAAGVGILWPILSVADRNDRAALVVLAAICAPTLMTLRFAGQAGLVAALTLFAWPLLFRGRGLIGGGMLAVAGALKIFPLILLVPLLLRRRYLACAATIGGFLILNLGGLALPGVSLAGAWRAMTEASSTWVGMQSSGSLVTAAFRMGMSQTLGQVLVVLALSVFLTFAVMVRKERVMSDPLPWIIVGLLVIPLSWVSYDLIIMPALASLLLARHALPRRIGLAGWFLWVAPVLVYSFALVDLGTSSVVVRLMMLGAWWIGWLTWTDSGLSSTWVAAPSRVRAETELSTM